MNLKEIWGQNIEVVIKNFTPEIEKSLGKQVLKNHKKKGKITRVCVPPSRGGVCGQLTGSPAGTPKQAKKKAPKPAGLYFLAKFLR